MTPRARTVRILVALISAAAVTSAGPAGATPAPSPWLQDGYNGAGSNNNSAEHRVTAANVARLAFEHQVASNADLSSPCSAGVSHALFSAGRVYAVNGTAVQAYNASSGHLSWQGNRRLAATESATGLAVAQGRVLVGTATCGTGESLGAVEMFDSATGRFVRTLAHPSSTSLEDFAVSGKLVVAKYTCTTCAHNEQTIAYRLPYGTVAWSTTHPSRYTATGSAAVVGGRVFAQARSLDGVARLYALDVATGRIAWRKAGSWSVISGDTDAASARSLLVSTGPARVVVLDPATGATRFSLTHTAAIRRTTVVGSRTIFASCDTGGNALCAYRAADGIRRWQTSGQYFTAAGANGLLVLGDGDILRQDTGARVTTFSDFPALIGSGRLGQYVSASGADGLSFEWTVAAA